MSWEKIGGIQNDGLFRHSETKLIKFRKYREGKGEIDRACRTTSLEKARRVRDELMAELWGETPLKSRRALVREIWPIWQAAATGSSRDATKMSVDASRKHLEPYIFDRFIDEITGEWWQTVYVPQKRAEINEKTGLTREKRKFFNDRKWLSMFLKWCDENGKTPAGWKKPKLSDPDPPRDVGKAYEWDEYERMLDAADWSMMTKLVMSCEHFMRRSEVALMAKDRIDRKKRTIHLRALDTKIKKPRTFPYNESLEWLFLILETRPTAVDSPWLFPSPGNPAKSIGRGGFQTAWQSIRRIARVSGRWHDLRHTGLTWALKRPGANVALICTFAGLAIDEAQKTYLHFTTDDMRGVENMVGAGPRSGEIRVGEA